MGESDPAFSHLFSTATQGTAPAGPAQRRKPYRHAQGTDAGPESKAYRCAQDTVFNLHAARPAAGLPSYVVAADGSGDFSTVQGALDFVASGTGRVTFTIKPGTYREILRSTGRNGIVLSGTDRDACFIRAINNDTPQGGSKAEALFFRGQRCAILFRGQRCAIRNCLFHSFQDTMPLDGRVYLADCRIEGTVNYIWGRGVKSSYLARDASGDYPRYPLS